MLKRKKIEWIETSRRGKNQPLLVVDSVMELYLQKYWGKAHHVRWNVQSYRQFDNARWFGEESHDRYTRILKQKEKKEKGYLLKLGTEYHRRIKMHRAFADKYKAVDFTDKSNQYLVKVFSEWFEITKLFWCFAYDYIFLNMFMPDELMAVVAQRVPDVVKQNKYFGVLVTADKLSEMFQEKKALLEIVQFMKKARLPITHKRVRQRIRKHLIRFTHLGYYYFRGAPYDENVVFERLREYKKLSSQKFQTTIVDIRNQLKNKEQTRKLILKLKLDPQTVYKIKILKCWSALSNEVDETYGYVVYTTHHFWMEIANRLGLRELQDVASFRADEIITYLKKGKSGALLRKVARERRADHAHILERGRVYTLVCSQLSKYRKKEQKKRQQYYGVTELKGHAASPGMVSGRVTVVYSIHDLDKVHRGDIIVTDATNPTYVPAMERAKAIVTDEGGLLCHAAIVSRELKVPCVVGTKIATKVLRSGDRIKVDARRGIIKKL